jgi:hypothetical protein
MQTRTSAFLFMQMGYSAALIVDAFSAIRSIVFTSATLIPPARDPSSPKRVGRLRNVGSFENGIGQEDCLSNAKAKLSKRAQAAITGTININHQCDGQSGHRTGMFSLGLQRRALSGALLMAAA